MFYVGWSGKGVLSRAETQFRVIGMESWVSKKESSTLGPVRRTRWAGVTGCAAMRLGIHF